MKQTLLILVCVVISVFGDDDLINLNDDNFEHLTQAATGATTGDWLVLMAGKDCTDCPAIETEMKKVAEELKGRINVAKLDSEASRLTLRRFKVGKKPAIMFFRLGYQWIYNRRKSSQDIIRFVTNGYMKENSRPVLKALDRFDVWQEDFVKEMKAAYKERRLPERDTFLTALAGLVVGLLILVCVCSPKKKEVEATKVKKATKKRR